MMGRLGKFVLFILVLMAVLHNTLAGKKGTGSKSTAPKKPPDKPSQGTKTQPNYPRQPSNPAAGNNPGYPNQQSPGRGGAGSYPPGGSYPSAGGNPSQYPGKGGSNPGYPNPNPGGGTYSAGSYPNQNPGRGGSNPGGYPNPNPGGGTYSAGSYPNQNPGRGGSNPGGYPNPNPGGGTYPAGSYPNQYPGRGGSNPGGYPNPNPGGGTYPAGSYPNQYPGRGGSNPGGYPNPNPGGGTYPAGSYPNQYPGRGGSNPGGYPNQNPGGGGYPNQYPGRSGYNPGGYPAGGSYPVRNAGQPGFYPGGQPPSGAGYPNWNPNNQILSPRYGGSFGGGGTGGSHFSQSVKSMGYGPSAKSKGFGKKAVMAVGVGAMAGMAVGYGIGNFQRPNHQFRSPQEERYYNNYMYQRQDTHFKDRNNKKNPSNISPSGTDKTSERPAQAQSYDQFMNTCMRRSDLLRDQDTKDSAVHNTIQRDESVSGYPALNEDSLQNGEPERNGTASPTPVHEYTKAVGIYKDEDDETVSIVQIGYPVLIEQMKSRKCVELYLVYYESFQEREKDGRTHKTQQIPKLSSNHYRHRISEVLLFLTSSIMLVSST